MVRRSTVAVLLVVVLVLLSGCSAVLDGNGNGNGSGNGNGATDAPDDPSSFDYADGYGPDGVTDGQAALESHRSSVIARGSYTGRYTYDIEDSDGSRLVDIDTRVDFEGEEGRQRADVDTPQATGKIDIYRDSETRYRKSVFNNQTSFSSSNQSFDPENLTSTEPIQPLLLNLSEYEASVEERNGVTVIVYERNGTEGVDSFLGINESADVTSFSATFAVDTDGVVRSANYQMTYTLNGSERGLAVEYSLSSFGETSVDRPAWVDQA